MQSLHLEAELFEAAAMQAVETDLMDTTIGGGEVESSAVRGTRGLCQCCAGPGRAQSPRPLAVESSNVMRLIITYLNKLIDITRCHTPPRPISSLLLTLGGAV